MSFKYGGVGVTCASPCNLLLESSNSWCDVSVDSKFCVGGGHMLHLVRCDWNRLDCGVMLECILNEVWGVTPASHCILFSESSNF